jgi:valyl-tRNA synthetase
VLAFLGGHVDTLRVLLNTRGAPVLEPPGGPREPGTTGSVVPSAHGPIEVLVSLKGLVSGESEAARIDRGIKKIDKEVAVIDKKLGSPGFVDRAPPEVVAEAKAQREALVEARARLEAARKLIDEL